MQPKFTGKVRLMFQDEAGFGRINKPKRCWCSKKTRPSVPCHHIREYRYAYGAVEPTTGDHSFLVLPRCDTTCMNVFLEELSKAYPDDHIILLCSDQSQERRAKNNKEITQDDMKEHPAKQTPALATLLYVDWSNGNCSTPTGQWSAGSAAA